MLTAPTLDRVRRRQGPGAAVHCPSGLERSGPIGALPVEMLELEPSCVASMVVSGQPWWSADPQGRMATAMQRQCGGVDELARQDQL